MPRCALLLALLIPVACATPPPPAPIAAAESIVERPKDNGNNNGQLEFELASGTYVCDLGHRVDVLRDRQARDQIQIGWAGNRYRLQRDLSFSGLPRYEDQANGLVWIDLPWKSVLLDGKTQKPLANECKTA